jgi:hypothetical protein
LATTIGLQAQLVAHCEGRKDFGIRRHADRRYTPSFPRWCHAIHTRACPRNKLSQGLTEAIEADLSRRGWPGIAPVLRHGQGYSARATGLGVEAYRSVRLSYEPAPFARLWNGVEK